MLVGPNNVGKSTLLEAILLLKQSAADVSTTDALVTTGPWTNLGGFYDILRGGQAAKTHSFSISLTIPTSSNRLQIHGAEIENGDTLEMGNEFYARFSFDREDNTITVDQATYAREGQSILTARRQKGEFVATGLSSAVASHTVLHPRRFLPLLHGIGEPPRDPEVMREVLVRLLESEYNTHVWRDLLERVAYVSAVRQPVPRFGVVGEVRPHMPGHGGIDVMRALRGASQLNAVNEWISSQFGVLKALRLVNVDESGDVNSLVGDEHQGFSNINVAHMGQGVSAARGTFASGGASGPWRPVCSGNRVVTFATVHCRNAQRTRSPSHSKANSRRF